MPIRRPSQTSSKPAFAYHPRTAEQMKHRASQGAGSRDGFVSQEVKFFTPRPGDNRVRILPPTWPEAPHYGLELFVHYGIGTDNSAYLCLDKNPSSPQQGCPICAERAKSGAAGEKEYSDSLRPNKRIAVYVIDRDRPQEGVLLWNMPWTIDRDICAQAVDRDTNEVFQPDDPENGYDVLFRREGQGQTTKYAGVSIARKSQPLSDDPGEMQAWLDYAVAHPVPDQLVFFEAGHIQKVFAGAVAATTHAEPTPAVRAQASPAVAGKAQLLTGSAVLAMTEEKILALIEEKGLEAQLGAAFDGELTDLKQAVVSLLWPANEVAEATPPKAAESLKERLARLRQQPRT